MEKKMPKKNPNRKRVRRKRKKTIFAIFDIISLHLEKKMEISERDRNKEKNL